MIPANVSTCGQDPISSDQKSDDVNDDQCGCEWEWQYVNTIPIRSIVGGLIYLSNTTRPDFTCAVSELARYMAKPDKTHF